MSETSASAADRILTVVCALLIAAVAALLFSNEVSGPSGPAAFETRTKPVQVLEGSYQLPVVVENTGGTAATKVDVHADVQIGGKGLTATSTVDFLAPSEKATAVFVFPRDPRKGTVSVAVRSYVEP